MKPGYKTTEFWTTAAVSIVTLLNQAMGWNIPPDAVATAAGLAASYAIGRGLAKKA